MRRERLNYSPELNADNKCLDPFCAEGPGKDKILIWHVTHQQNEYITRGFHGSY